jgi:hypothetical protein
MTRIKLGLRGGVVGGIALAVACTAFTLAFAQNSAQSQYQAPGPVVGGFDKVHILPPGGPVPRTSDGHPDLTGRWHTGSAGRMLQFAYPIDPAIIRQFDPDVTPEQRPVFKPGLPAKYRRPPSPTSAGECDQPGTPSTVLEQVNQHAPMELVQLPGKLWMFFEYPMDIRLVRMDGRPHPKDPDPSFNGDSIAHWEKDTLVIDVIAIDERVRNQGPFLSRTSNPTLPGGGDTTQAPGAQGGQGGGGAWWHSDQERVIERITRTSKNYLTYEVTIEDPVVLAKPWKSAPRIWTLAQDPNDEWTEVFCTLNEEPAEIQRLNAATKTKAGEK